MVDKTNMKSLKETVERRLHELDRNPFEAAKKGGLNEHFINDLLIGKKAPSKPKTLQSSRKVWIGPCRK